jgi:hypothetical protein
MAAAQARWGSGPVGRELISHSVCKGKYRPFALDDGRQLFGCFRHSKIRKQRIDRAGLREGWASFDQWAPLPTVGISTTTPEPCAPAGGDS